MALDKLVDSTQLDNNLTSVANAIRAKSGGTGQLAFPAGFVSEIGNISTGGGGITPTGTKEITITENGTTTEDVTNYASAAITVNVPSSGGGDPVYGLITEYTVTEQVDTISIPMTALVLADHRVFIELDNLAHTSDYLYVMADNMGKSGPYLKTATVENCRLQLFFGESKTIAGKEFRGGYSFSATITGGGAGTVLTYQNYTPSNIVLALYKSTSVFTGGTVRIYGRIA